MALTYAQSDTALLLVDPYNDFLSEGGKLYPHIEEVAAKVNLLENLSRIVDLCRSIGITIFFVPHRRWRAERYGGWINYAPTQERSRDLKLFADGEWGGEFHPDFQPHDSDVIVQEHWAQSGFANTDLDMLLKKRGVQKIIIVGLRVNTCIDSTARYGMELGYHVTLITDATAGFSWDEMDASHRVNAPTFAHAVLNTTDFVTAVSTNH